MTDTAGSRSADEVIALLRARNALIVVESPEEGRIERALIEPIAAAKYDVRIWDCTTGVTDAAGKEAGPGRSCTDSVALLQAIRDSNERAVWILRDLVPWLKDPVTCRALRSLARSLQTAPAAQARTMILLTPRAELPPELQDHAVVVRWQMPDRAEIGVIFDNLLAGVPEDVRERVRASRAEAIEAAVGLTAEGAARAFAKSLVTQGRRIVPAVIAADKRQVVSGKGIEWFDPEPRGLDAVGGLENLKPWLAERKDDFTEEARAFGLPPPKGVLTVGVPGCGKSLLAKATATAFGCPLLRADVGAAQSKWVGESQENIRRVFTIAETVGRCVLWFDEIEKALAGATQGAADGGVSADMLGVFLSWMQERKGEVFVFATSNDVSKLPPELLRKGRFDELFFVDLPTFREREDIARVCLRKYGRADHPVDAKVVASNTIGFTGAEIDALFPVALRRAFKDGKRSLWTDDVVAAANVTVPLSKTAAQKIDELRAWAKGRARPASAPEDMGAGGTTRALDL